MSSIGPPGKAAAMNDKRAGNGDPPSREERLAAKLRENLRLRKAQARAIEAGMPPLPKEGPDS